MFLGVDDKYKLRPPDEDGRRSSTSTTTGSSTSSASSTRRKNGLDVMVTHFSSLDPTVGNTIARNCKEKQWKVTFNPEAAPIDIKLHVHSHRMNANAVSIESDGQALFYGSAPNSMVDMTEDLCYEWTLSGTSSRPTVSCIDCFVPFAPQRQPTSGSQETPLSPGPSSRAFRKDSTTTSNHSLAVHSYSGVSQNFHSEEVLSEVGSDSKRRAARVPTGPGRRVSWAFRKDISSVRLHVPKQDPSRSVLTMDGEAVTFGRLSPAPDECGEEKQQIRLKLSKDLSIVTANVGHSILSHFMSGQVRAVTCRLGLLMRSWTVQLGPFATHSITVSKNYTFGKIITLVVDGEVFVESNAADLGFDGCGWQCHFSFMGERDLDFETFDADKANDETSHKEEKQKYVHKCCVVVPKDFNFGNARFFVDGIDFNLLPKESADSRPEIPLSVTTETLQELYGISVPGQDGTPNKMQRLGNSIASFFSSSSLRSVVTI